MTGAASLPTAAGPVGVGSRPVAAGTGGAGDPQAAAGTRARVPGARREVRRPGDGTDGTDTGIADRAASAGGIGASAIRPDGTLKVTGQFAYGSDLWMADMLWGVTLRSPHPYARISGIKIGEALATTGVYAVLTHEDVPGANACGLERPDQPVLAEDVVRYQGEPVALVAADHPEIALRAATKIVVDYEVLEPVTDARTALGPGAPRLHDGGNLVRHLKIRKGEPEPSADVVVTGEYTVGMQDQAFLGPEAGLAVPDGAGGVDLYVATQWLHVDQRQICAALGLPPEQVRLFLAGVGGAFGGREDLSMHVHACLLALHTGKPSRSRWSTTGRSPSSGTCTGTRPRCATSTAPAGTAPWPTSGPRSTSTAGPTRPAPRPWSATAARWGSGPTSCRTCTSTPTAPTPTTRRAGRCAASARCRRRSATRRRWTSSRPPSAWTRSSCAAATR